MLNIFFKALGTFIRGKNLTSAPQKWWHISYKMRFKTALYRFHFYMLCHCPNFCTSHHWVTSISNITKMLPRHLFPRSWLTDKGSVDHALKVVCYTHSKGCVEEMGSAVQFFALLLNITPSRRMSAPTTATIKTCFLSFLNFIILTVHKAPMLKSAST